jgi:hypothetical protein
MLVPIKSLNIQANLCKTFLSQAIGFMFSFSRKNAKLFVFDREKNIDIHMFFVFFPLIVVWLNKDKKIVKIKKMYPFISYSGARAKYLLEIPYSKEIWNKLNKNK